MYLNCPIMKTETNRNVIILWILLFSILAIVFCIAYIRQNPLRFPPRNNPSGIDDRIGNTCKCQSTQGKNCQERLTVIIFYTNPNCLSICRYFVGKVQPGSHN